MPTPPNPDRLRWLVCPKCGRRLACAAIEFDWYAMFDVWPRCCGESMTPEDDEKPGPGDADADDG